VGGAASIKKWTLKEKNYYNYCGVRLFSSHEFSSVKASILLQLHPDIQLTLDRLILRAILKNRFARQLPMIYLVFILKKISLKALFLLLFEIG